jgi:hypothetical protein
MKDDIIQFSDERSMRLGIFGTTGRGKTYLACKMLRHMLKDKFDEIYLIHPEFQGEKKNAGKWDTLEITQVFEFFTQELVHQLVEHCKKTCLDLRKKGDDFRMLIILDDCVSDDQFTNKQRSELGKAFTNSRKYGLSLMILSQKITLIPQQIHSQLNYVILFDTGFAKESKSIYDSYGLHDRKKWYRLCDFIFKDIHDTMLIDVDYKRYYKNFNIITIKEN